MEVAECSVAGIAGVELRRYLPSGLAGGVVKDEEAVGVGGCRNQGPQNGDYTFMTLHCIYEVCFNFKKFSRRT